MRPVAEVWGQYKKTRHDRDWEQVIQALYPPLAAVVFRVSSRWGAVDSGQLQDVLQEVFLKISEQRSELVANVPVQSDAVADAYFKALAANATHDYWKHRRAQKRDDGQTVNFDDRLGEFLEGGFGAVRAIERNLLFAQIDGCLPADGHTRTIFWLYYRQGLTAREISAIPEFRLTVKGVESTIHRQTLEVRQKLREPRRESPS